ncbi:MAG: YeiH family protein [Polyangiaceae bacterium]|nr:YeiH family protein [Polyangiaceae bacterium]
MVSPGDVPLPLEGDASADAAPILEPTRPGALRVLRLVPGVALLFALGYAGKWVELAARAYGKTHHVALPNIEYVLWAIIFGLIAGNVLAATRSLALFRPGIDTYELFLKVGIVLLGARFLLGDVVKLGGLSLLLVVLEFAIAGTAMVALGRAFGLGPKLTALLAVGSSVCGVSAIIATQGAIDADDEDTSYAIGAILALGAVGLFAFPAIGHALQMSDHAFGLWVGLAIDNTAEVTAAGNLYSDEAGKWAVLAKTARNATIGFVVLGVALYFAARAGRSLRGSRGRLLWTRFPKFVLGFILVSALASAHVLRAADVAALGNLSRWAFLLTFAGVGLKTNFAELRRQGVRPLIVGAIGEVGIAAVTLAMVLGADAIVRL